MEKPSRKIIAMPVYSIHEGQNLGRIRSLVINPEKKEVLALLVEKRSLVKESKVVFFNHIKSIGENVITLDKSSYMQVQKNANFPEALQYMRRPVRIITSKVLTESGKELGKVDEFFIDCVSGKITRLELTGSFSGSLLKDTISLNADYISTIGADVIIVKDAAEEELFIRENNIKQTLGKAGDMWNQTGKKIGFRKNTGSKKEQYIEINPSTPQQGEEKKEVMLGKEATPKMNRTIKEEKADKTILAQKKAAIKRSGQSGERKAVLFELQNQEDPNLAPQADSPKEPTENPNPAETITLSPVTTEKVKEENDAPDQETITEELLLEDTIVMETASAEEKIELAEPLLEEIVDTISEQNAEPDPILEQDIKEAAEKEEQEEKESEEENFLKPDVAPTEPQIPIVKFGSSEQIPTTPAEEKEE